jgi:hypothetical protein
MYLLCPDLLGLSIILQVCEDKNYAEPNSGSRVCNCVGFAREKITGTGPHIGNLEHRTEFVRRKNGALRSANRQFGGRRAGTRARCSVTASFLQDHPKGVLAPRCEQRRGAQKRSLTTDRVRRRSFSARNTAVPMM